MNEAPSNPPVSKWKNFLAIAAFLAVFYTVVPFVMSGGLAQLFSNGHKELEMVLADARVTDVRMNRQQYSYYLDGEALGWHDFNAFVAADPAARKDMDPDLGYDPSDLGHYLRHGDRLPKQPTRRA